MGQDPELSDLQAFDPDMYKQLTELLRMKRNSLQQLVAVLSKGPIIT